MHFSCKRAHIHTDIHTQTQPSFHTYPFEPWNKLKFKKKNKKQKLSHDASLHPIYIAKKTKNTDATTVHVFFTTNILGGAQHVVVSISTLACEQKHRYLKTNKQNISSEKLSLLFLWTTEVKGHLEGLKKVQRLEEVTRWELWPWAEALCFCVCVCVSTRLF